MLLIWTYALLSNSLSSLNEDSRKAYNSTMLRRRMFDIGNNIGGYGCMYY